MSPHVIKYLRQVISFLEVQQMLELLDVLDKAHALHTPLVVLSILVREHEHLLA